MTDSRAHIQCRGIRQTPRGRRRHSGPGCGTHAATSQSAMLSCVLHRARGRASCKHIAAPLNQHRRTCSIGYVEPSCVLGVPASSSKEPIWSSCEYVWLQFITKSAYNRSPSASLNGEKPTPAGMPQECTGAYRIGMTCQSAGKGCCLP